MYKPDIYSINYPKYLDKIVMMIYAYTQKIYYCRNIAKPARENLMAIWLYDSNKSDFKTINTFRFREIDREWAPE